MQGSENYFFKGVEYFQQEQFEKALVALNQALMVQSDHFDALQLLGIIYDIKKEHHRSIEYFNLALSLQNKRSDIWVNKANALISIKNYQDAIQCLIKGIELDQNSMEAKYALGMAYAEVGELTLSLDVLKKLNACIGSNDPQLLNSLSIVLTKLKHYDEALELIKKAKRLNAQVPNIWCNEGIIYQALKQPLDALTCYDQAISLDPNYAQAWYNRGASLHDLSRYDEALECYDKALTINPNYAQAWSNKGVTYGVLGRYDEALNFFKKAYHLDPAYADGGWNQSLMNLLLGNFLNAWQTYECRWKKDDPHPYLYPQFPFLASLDAVKDKTILVWSEQGFGDTIHFSRYVPMLAKLGAKVIFEVQAPLKELILSLPQCKVISRGESFPIPDFQIPLISLPGIFETQIESIPGKTPYLAVADEKIFSWNSKLHLNPQKINIGIACSGNSKHQNDINRSMPLQVFSRLLENPRVELFLIQKELREDDLAFFQQEDRIHFLGDEIADFSDSAAIVENMDLIISVDTSLVHLAGALNKKVFVLLPWSPEWRWLLARSDSPWYPTATLFRQPSVGNWGAMMDEVYQCFSRGA